ncbi:WxL domain-containing protein [Enterococcus hirae]
MKKTTLLAVAALLAPTMLSTGVSAATTPTQNDTQVNAQFTVSSTDTTNPTPPGGSVDPSEPNKPSNPGNSALNPTSTFALSYIPYQFDFGTTDLTGKSSIEVPATPQSGKSFNVGVKNTTHTTQGWTLSASLTGDLATYGAQVKTTVSASSAKVNNNGVLEELPTNNMITVKDNAEISSTDNVIMTGNDGNVFAGTYDLNLGNVSLNIPDTSKVPSGDATGTITWNLAQTPQQP